MDILVLILAIMSQLSGFELIIGENGDIGAENAQQVDAEFVQDGAGRLGDGRLER
ncbi:MAG: hypothetical protein JNK85_02215 [Verrucomicrobiales bacterium]|nr:hypothetical protein [Verrucomicrobiales bacterium]